jgi:glucokinase
MTNRENLNSTAPIVLGIDIGGTKIKSLALEGPEKILAEFETPSFANEGPQNVRQAIKQCVRHYESLRIPFSKIGIGCAGSVDSKRGIVRNSPNFSDWKNISIREWIETDFDLPSTIDNDANCAVYAEWKQGNGKGHQNIILLTLGTGIGGGLILDGKLFKGATGTAGEIGHLSMQFDGPKCSCGHSGCFEIYCSGNAVRAKTGGLHTSKEVFTQANTAEFEPIFLDFMSRFESVLTSLANIFDPEIILLGGAVSSGVSLHIEEIKKGVKNRAFPAVAENLKILPAKFGNQSGCLGAALLSMELVD